VSIGRVPGRATLADRARERQGAQIPAVQVSPPLHRLPAQQTWPLAPQLKEHTPATQPWLLGQTVPHWPQWVLLVWRFVSQPFVRLVSQSPKPATQLHCPERQSLVRVLFIPPEGHLEPQAPQLAAEVRRSASQPLKMLLSQLPKFVSQPSMVQTLLLQLLVATCGRSLQSFPQPPQFVRSLLVVVSQPSPVFKLQSARPEMHTRLAQALATQLALPTPGSVLQLLLQPLQLVDDEVMLTSQPSPEMLLQLAKPVLHELKPQVPPEQVFTALARVQAMPQVDGCTGPQCAVLVRVFTQLPEQLTVPV
jgi:hypothetical protein